MRNEKAAFKGPLFLFKGKHLTSGTIKIFSTFAGNFLDCDEGFES